MIWTVVYPKALIDTYKSLFSPIGWLKKAPIYA